MFTFKKDVLRLFRKQCISKSFIFFQRARAIESIIFHLETHKLKIVSY